MHISEAFHNSTHAARADASCSSTITPSCLQQFYNIPTTPATQKTNTMAVSSFVQSFASNTDLSSFLTKFRTDLSASTTFSVAAVDGGTNDESKPSTEGVRSRIQRNRDVPRQIVGRGNACEARDVCIYLLYGLNAHGRWSRQSVQHLNIRCKCGVLKSSEIHSGQVWA